VIAGGAPGEASNDAPNLAAAALRAPDPAVVVLQVPDASELPAAHPAHGKSAGAYVCRAAVCSLPVTEPAALAALLRRT